ncbi:sulfatase-like hydrolase/transferase [Aureliella helgolandensis]|uniref:Arylsulfatase n=1 Tax=Aureliella helgolandensis TaxID=2527968 RepID=A0A518G285_9BACT|nr:sulfatase-like hydrolase/transferase [Aureliella helgolandensis]QDV22737.1 Arylsulfatase [Aureliella helgolandensis]
MRIVILLAASLLASRLLCWQEACWAESPNVILVMCDDLGYGDLTSFRAACPIHTPHLDALAEDGMRFTRFYSAAPVCSPTRGSCLTGRHPFRYGIYHANTGHLKPQEITLPELLKTHGYTTGHFGKWHLGTLTTDIQDANRGGPRGAVHFSPPSQHGYDESFVTESKVPTYDPMIKPAKAGNSWDAMERGSKGGKYGTRYWDHAGNVVTENLQGDDSRVVMDRAIPFIEQAVASETPFFSAIWFHAPHLPVVASETHRAPYAEHDVLTRNYYGCISALDEQVGRLRAKLQQLGVADNTLICFCSDNGPEGQASNSPGSAGEFRGRKRSLYEGGVRVPGIIVWPGHVPAGTATDFPAVTSDYLPTVLDILGIEYPAQRPLDGESLASVFNNPQAERSTGIGFQSSKQIAWHRSAMKLLSNDQGSTWELYDLTSDPGETTDLAPMQPQIVAALQTEVTAWLASCKASDSEQDYAVIPKVAAQQAEWYEKYKGQANIPQPEAMLLNTEVEPELQEGFTSLLKVHDLTGWTPRGGTCKFAVHEGIITGTVVPGSNSTYLSTDRSDYTDFIFTCDMRWEVSGNSGVMFRAQTKTSKGAEVVFGPQAEMEGTTGDRGWSGGIYGQSCGGYFYPLWLEQHQAVREALNKEGWNRLTIKAVGNDVKTWLNGVPAAHWVDDGTYPSGFFGLQVHKGEAGEIQWKNLRVKELR